ncbi:MAG TPA: ATP-binding protein [Desulfobacteria bacterium]|nr:ATP-binding protein [Desulfobacteria bacterium]
MPPPKNILVADDESAILKLIEKWFRDEDYCLFFASDGEEAVLVAENHPIDLAILDLVMPKMGGLDSLREIKKIDKNTEVLIITGNADLNGLEKVFFDYGVVDYLIKPFDMVELKLTVRRVLHKTDIFLRNSNENEALRARIAELEKDFHEKTFRLRESQIKYKNIVNNSTDAIVVIQDNAIKFVNKRFEDFSGHSRDEIIDIPFSELLHCEDCAQAKKDGHEDEMVEDYLVKARKFRIRKKDGAFLWVENQIASTTWEDMPATLCFLRDISKKKHMEEMMVRSEKMASLGQLSAGLAHELRNPLAVISSCAQFCLENMDVSGLLSENFRVIHRNSQRASKLIQELLAFARADQLKWKSLNLNQLIEKMLNMARMGLGASEITFAREFDEGLPEIPGDEEKLGQVCINLIQNAIQAIPEDGRITLETGWDATRDAMLEFSVTDNGPGIPVEHRKRIFDPFFTTKDGGTGLGLSICDAIVMQHHGFISVECKATGECRFSVKLPTK